MAKNKGASGVTISKSKRAGKAATWIVRKSDGTLSTVKERPRSAETMDNIVKQYAGTMKRLADR
jgi:hypothetical protein